MVPIRSRVLVFLAISGSALLASSCRRAADNEIPWGAVAHAVEVAGREGRPTVTVVHVWEGEWADTLPLARAVRMFSVMYAEASGRSVVAVDADSIRTWHVFRPMEMISRGSDRSERCTLALPRSVALGVGEVAVPLVQGSMTLRGVRVTMESEHSDVVFKPGERFVMFVQECEDGVFTLPLGIKGGLPVADDQRIRNALPEGDLPTYARDLLKIGTVDELRRRIQDLQGSGQ